MVFAISQSMQEKTFPYDVMQFYASNQGGMCHVTIRSGYGQDKIGLDLKFSGNNGTLLINILVFRASTSALTTATATFDSFALRK